MADSPRHDRRIASAIALFFVVLYGGFHHGHFKGTDEVGVYETTRSLYELGRLSVPPGQHAYRGADGAVYSHFAVGQSILALPFYGLGALGRSVLPRSWETGMAGPPRVIGPIRWGGRIEIFATSLYAPVASAMLVALFFLFERSLDVSVRSSVAAALALGCTTYVAPMSAYFLRHTTEAILILGALLALLRWARNGRRTELLLGCALASAILLVRIPAAIAGPGLAVTLAWGLARVHGTETMGAWLRAFVRESPWILTPFVVAVAIHLGLNHVKWGTWLASPMLPQWQLFSTPLSEGLAGFLISPSTSLFLYSPPLLVACVAFPRFLRTHRVAALSALGISLSFLFVCAKFGIWSGLYSAPGPRYLFVVTPLLMLAVGPWLDAAEGRASAIAWWSSVAVGCGIQFVLLAGSWGAAIQLLGYASFEPKLGFLFIPEMSPLVGYVYGFAEGRLDPWIWNLARGWKGVAPAPGIAAALVALWLLATTACGVWLRRAVRAAHSA